MEKIVCCDVRCERRDLWKTSVTCTTVCSQIDRGIPFSVYPSSAPHAGRYRDVSARHLTPLTCSVHLTSQPRYVISAVLLEHSLCGGDGGGVFVLLWDKAKRRSWDVCSVWQAPGPDFQASSNVADLSIEWTEVLHPFNLNISIRATEKIHKGQLESRYLSATEGEVFFIFFYPHCL